MVLLLLLYEVVSQRIHSDSIILPFSPIPRRHRRRLTTLTRPTRLRHHLPIPPLVSHNRDVEEVRAADREDAEDSKRGLLGDGRWRGACIRVLNSATHSWLDSVPGREEREMRMPVVMRRGRERKSMKATAT